MSDRKEILYWAEVARQIVSNPRKKIICRNKVDFIEFEIAGFPEFNKIEIRMKCGDMKENIVVTMDMDLPIDSTNLLLSNNDE